MEEWELGFHEKKNPDMSKTLELEIDGAKPEDCPDAPKPTKPSNATTTSAGTGTTAGLNPSTAPYNGNGGPTSTKTSMGLVAAATLMALFYKY